MRVEVLHKTGFLPPPPIGAGWLSTRDYCCSGSIRAASSCVPTHSTLTTSWCHTPTHSPLTTSWWHTPTHLPLTTSWWHTQE